MATTNKDGKTYLEENETATGINFEADQQDAIKNYACNLCSNPKDRSKIS